MSTESTYRVIVTAIKTGHLVVPYLQSSNCPVSTQPFQPESITHANTSLQSLSNYNTDLRTLFKSRNRFNSVFNSAASENFSDTFFIHPNSKNLCLHPSSNTSTIVNSSIATNISHVTGPIVFVYVQPSTRAIVLSQANAIFNVTLTFGVDAGDHVRNFFFNDHLM